MSLLKDTDGKFNWDRVSVILGIVISLGGLTYLGNSINDRVEDAFIIKLNQPDSKLNYHINIKGKEIAKVTAEEVLNSEASLLAVTNIFDGFNKMPTKELKNYLEETMDFSDEMKEALGDMDSEDLAETLEWIEEQRDIVSIAPRGATVEKHKTCGNIIMKNGIPFFFVTEDSDLVEIKYGKPLYTRHATDLCYRYKVYYIETDRGPRVLTSISDIKLKKCE
tara:strand:- start:4512 stop:5177 length:666 start_codon:yes stop_codon:yes gene_type:complete